MEIDRLLDELEDVLEISLHELLLRTGSGSRLGSTISLLKITAITPHPLLHFHQGKRL